jgi:hypothetical protein
MSDDLIKRGDALNACDIGPCDEWSDFTKSGYNLAAEDCKRNIAALPAVTVNVNALVWEKDSLKGSYPTRFRANMPCKSGDYSVAGSERANLWQWFRNGYFVDGHQTYEPMTLNAAKAAAQADYKARILAAIDTQTEPRDAAVARLVEAASEQLAYMDMCGDKGDLERNLRAAIAAVKGGEA